MVNHFPQKLKYYRKTNNITQQQLADKLNITRQAISAYENGSRFCDLDILIRIADIFNITLDELIR